MDVVCCLLAMVIVGTQPLEKGNHTRELTVDELKRSYIVHVPPKYDANQPTPMVMVLHGAGMNAGMMAAMSGMNTKSDAAGFVVVYPNGTGVGPLQTWNAGGLRGKISEKRPDDVKYLRQVIDDVASVVNVDRNRVFATGLSNGGMMSYRMAIEMPDQIAAIAPVAGTMTCAEAELVRPVAVMHFHGTSDTIVPYAGPGKGATGFMTFESVDETIAMWCRMNGCSDMGQKEALPDSAEDGTTSTREVYGAGKQSTEVVLIKIEGGGHNWPGGADFRGLLGKTCKDFQANDLIWEFFQKHPMPAK